MGATLSPSPAKLLQCGSCPGRVIGTIIQNRIANPVVVVDEIEKAGTPVSTKGSVFGKRDADPLLPFLS
ncbi:hypothetical protein [Paracoccus alcaliphilus]|uniref:hypothetical protein n=1 Tax=Paracoccus alcaliphilus TaxID=34002 RepID=UPI0011141CC9|nr:hypothetical protein [Paracoccus alcaliphilus]WCR16998.1 hypothetical protein JHW40_11370 [Paracoccus alcaliphilus]